MIPKITHSNPIMIEKHNEFINEPKFPTDALCSEF